MNTPTHAAPYAALPPPLRQGDQIAVVAPSRSLGMLAEETVERAVAVLEELGLRVQLGAHAARSGPYLSAPVADRLADLHAAFADPDVRGILFCIGGYSANQLAPYLDYDLIARNPKVVCGRSDGTVLLNAITCHAHLITYYGPSFADFGIERGNEYTVECFRRATFGTAALGLKASRWWSDDRWFEDQERRSFLPNPGPVVLQPGDTTGITVGGHLGTFGLLRGTGLLPSPPNPVLLIEEVAAGRRDLAQELDRQLESVLQQPAFSRPRGLLVGRFARADGVSNGDIATIVRSKLALRDVPVVANCDFGHTLPMSTVPIGARVRVNTAGERPSVTFRTDSPLQERVCSS